MTYNLMKKYLSILFLMIPFAAEAQILISDFESIATQAYLPFNDTWSNPVDQFTEGSGFISITSIAGGDPTGEGGFNANIDGSLDGSNPIDLTGYTYLSLTARVDAGNTSGFTVILLRDSAFEIIGTAQFLTSSFNAVTFESVTVPFELSGAGLLADAAYWTIAGDGLPGSYRMSLDNLSASTVPEPSACALLALGLMSFAFRRRHAMSSKSGS